MMVKLMPDERRQVKQIFADYYEDRKNAGRSPDNPPGPINRIHTVEHVIHKGLTLWVRLCSPNHPGDKAAFYYWFSYDKTR